MSSKDFWLLGFLGVCFAVLLSPAWFRPDLILGNFGDIYAYHYPLRHLAAARLQEGQVPFWNPYIFSGIPFLANSQAALFYPLSGLFHFFPIGYALTLHAMVHIALAALGAHLFFRNSGLDAAFSCSLAAAFCLAPFFIYRIPQGIPTHMAALSYMPWSWLALQSRRIKFLAGVWALQFLSGHPQFSLINVGAMALYVFWQKRYLARVFLGAGLLAASLCLVQGVLTVEFLSHSNRSQWPSQFAMAYSMPLSAFATLVTPRFWGVLWDGSFAGKPSEFFEMYATYVGCLPLALALYAFMLVARSSDRPSEGLPGPRLALLLAAAGVFLSLGRNNFLVEWISQIPILTMNRVPARFSFLVFWGVLLASAQGFLKLPVVFRVPTIKAAVFSLIVLDLGVWAAHFVHAENPKPYLAAHRDFADLLAGKLVRFATDLDIANPNKAMLYRAMNVNGYEAYYLSDYVPYAARAEKGPAADPSRTYIRSFESEPMQNLGVAYFLTPRDLGRSNSIFLSPDLRLYPSAAFRPLAYTLHKDLSEPGTSRLTIEAASPEKWILQGRLETSDSVLVLAVPHFPGWRAWVNGQRLPVTRISGLLQSVSLENIPKGDFQAYFQFKPPYWLFLCLFTSLAWICWAWAYCREFVDG